MRRALVADEPPGLSSRVEGSVLLLELAAPSAASARATAEDLLPCLAAAEEAEGLKGPRAASRPSPRP